MSSASSPRTRIAGVGAYAPEKILTNAALEALVDTTDEWIRERTGIRERHIAADGETTRDMALVAAKRALVAANLEPSDLDMIIVGTVTSDTIFPACAAHLQHKLGAKGIPSFDVSAACAGFMYAMSIGDRFIGSGSHKNILVVGVERLSSVTNWEDRGTCVLFGDGAGAAVLSPSRGDGAGILSTRMHTDGSLTESLLIRAGGSREPTTPELIAGGHTKIKMIGSDIFKHAVRNLTSASLDAVKDAGMELADVDWIIPHQANMRIISQVAARLKVPQEKLVLNIERYGNTSSASIPLAWNEAIQDGRIKPGQTVLACALGGGVSWASALIRM